MGGGGDTMSRRKYLREVLSVSSSADILSWEAFKRMSLDRDDLKPCKTTLIGFNGEQSRPKGFIDLRFTLGVKNAFKSERVRFIVADFVSPYNIILGRPTIHKWDMRPQRSSYPDRLDRDSPDDEVNTVELDIRDEEVRPEPAGDLEDLVVGDPLQTTKIGKHLSPELKSSLVEFLKENRDVFAWNLSQVPRIDPKFCCHKLEVYPGSIPVSQRKRNHGPEKRKALEIHIQELLEAGFIREIRIQPGYQMW
ncbi:hypothetical protein K1719_042101 [Acacia pycnantha]|nr:hypothetical protein K1719_042101 [Acacia pycnantha]